MRTLAEQFWVGDPKVVSLDSVSPISNPSTGMWAEVQPQVAFLLNFANVVAVGTLDPRGVSRREAVLHACRRRVSSATRCCARDGVCSHSCVVLSFARAHVLMVGGGRCDPRHRDEGRPGAHRLRLADVQRERFQLRARVQRVASAHVHLHVRPWAWRRLAARRGSESGALRSWRVVCCRRHGHVDHCFGIQRFDEEHASRGLPRPRVVAHRNVTKRFERYKLTQGGCDGVGVLQYHTAC